MKKNHLINTTHTYSYKIVCSLTNLFLHGTHIVSALPLPKKLQSLNPYPFVLSTHQSHHQIGYAGSNTVITFTLCAHSGLTHKYDPSG